MREARESERMYEDRREVAREGAWESPVVEVYDSPRAREEG